MKESIRNSPSYEALLSLVRTSDLLHKAGNQFFRSFGLTQSQFNILILLKYDFPSGAKQNSLSEKLLVNPADMTGLVKRMLKTGHVSRQADPGDDRAKIISLTLEGKKLLDKVEGPYYEVVEELTGFLKKSESEDLAKNMTELEIRIQKKFFLKPSKDQEKENK